MNPLSIIRVIKTGVIYHAFTMLGAAVPTTSVGALLAGVHVKTTSMAQVTDEVSFVPGVILPLDHAFPVHIVVFELAL